jgi:prevent-host-death family protein
MPETRISVAAARRDFAKILARAAKRGARIKVTRYRTTLAGIVSRDDLARLEECEKLLARIRTTRRAKARRSKPLRRRSKR